MFTLSYKQKCRRTTKCGLDLSELSLDWFIYPKQALNLMLASWFLKKKKKTELSVEVEANVKTIAP